MTLLDILPQPVPCPAAGRVVWVAPLRLVDLARLQLAAAVAVPCPLDAARAAIAAAEGEDLRRLLRDAYLACESWPPRVLTPGGEAALATPEGSLAWLGVVLGRHNPGLSGEDLAAILAGVTADEVATIARVAYGARPLDELARMIAPECFAPRKGRRQPEPTNWGKVFASVAAETGWTFGEIGELTLGQLAAWRTGGERGDDFPPPPGESREHFAQRMWRFFRGDR